MWPKLRGGRPTCAWPSLAGSLIVALIVLGYRFAHLTTSATPDVAAVNFFSLLPQATETSIFSSTFSTDLGVLVDNLSTSFMALTCFLILVVQAMATAMLRGDSGLPPLLLGAAPCSRARCSP